MDFNTLSFRGFTLYRNNLILAPPPPPPLDNAIGEGRQWVENLIERKRDVKGIGGIGRVGRGIPKVVKDRRDSAQLCSIT